MRGVTCQREPADGEAGRYWTLYPSSGYAVVERLASSTKSFVSVAPELPPPPYASEITTLVDGVAKAAGSGAMTTAAVAVAATNAAPATRTALGLCIGTG